MQHTIRVFNFAGGEIKGKRMLHFLIVACNGGLYYRHSSKKKKKNTLKNAERGENAKHKFYTWKPGPLSTEQHSFCFIFLVASVFLCSYLGCGEMFQLGAAPAHCLPASLTMLRVTGVHGPPVKIEQQVEMQQSSLIQMQRVKFSGACHQFVGTETCDDRRVKSLQSRLVTSFVQGLSRDVISHIKWHYQVYTHYHLQTSTLISCKQTERLSDGSRALEVN